MYHLELTPKSCLMSFVNIIVYIYHITTRFRSYKTRPSLTKYLQQNLREGGDSSTSFGGLQLLQVISLLGSFCFRAVRTAFQSHSAGGPDDSPPPPRPSSRATNNAPHSFDLWWMVRRDGCSASPYPFNVDGLRGFFVYFFGVGRLD
jgi:hypothetical protein